MFNEILLMFKYYIYYTSRYLITIQNNMRMGSEPVAGDILTAAAYVSKCSGDDGCSRNFKSQRRAQKLAAA